MAANVICPVCGKQCKPPESSSQSDMRCPACFSMFPIKRAPASPLLANAVASIPALSPTAINRTVLAHPEAMIRYTCPRCKKSLESPASFAGQKLNCPDCNQRLQIPQPSTASLAPPSVNRTLLATVEPPVAPPAQTFGPSTSPSPPEPKVEVVEEASPLSHEFDISEKCGRKHSGLGIASFIIALLVGGLDVILGLIVVLNIARSDHHHAGLDDFPTYRHTSQSELKASVLAGGTAMACLNCMSVPLCLVGVGLALVGLIAHRNCNHLFTWIGLIGNGVVILGVVGLYLLAAVIG